MTGDEYINIYMVDLTGSRQKCVKQNVESMKIAISKIGGILNIYDCQINI